MKHILTSVEYIKEQQEDTIGIADTHQERFDRQLYLHYVEMHSDHDFKHVSKEEFYNKLSAKFFKIKTSTFDKKRIYRLADEKDTWLSEHGHILGEVWKEDAVESYWIKVSN